MRLPEKGFSPEQIETALNAFKEHDLSWRDGRVLAYVYDAGPEAESVVKNAFSSFLSENALDPSTFPSTMQMERDIVRITAELLQGDERVVGNVTSGGTESIILAVKTARDWASANLPSITKPELILSRTAHPAFHKAAHYLGLKPVIVPFDEDTFLSDVNAMRAAINENTILLVASAPNYSHGVVDPVAEIATLALEQGVLCHVDACIGAFQLAFMRQIGYELPPYDFAVPGVTSISADLHKYGYSAKGASVLLYHSKELRRYQIYANVSTTTYLIINSTMLSTKSGGPLAAAWAILHYFGQEGYHKIVRMVMEATEKMIAGINAMADLRVLGKPDMCIFAIESDSINVFQLADVMKKKGWLVQPQLSKMASMRPNIHITVTQSVVSHVDDFLQDLQEAVQETKTLPPLNTAVIRAQIETLLHEIPEADVANALYNLAGIEGSKLPADMAAINTVLSVLPPHVAEEMLREYFNDLYV